MGRLRLNCGVIVAAGVAAIFAGPALAQSDICTRLEARLMALDSRVSGGDGEKTRALERQIDNQQAELNRAKEDARGAGCMGAFFRRLRSGANCGPMMASIDRMRANLNRLKAAHDRAGENPYAGSRERSELIRALSTHRCGDHYDNYDRRGGRRGFFASLFGGGLFRDRGFGRGLFDRGGTYRTLCVRRCDGYYFPISFSTVHSHFARDEQVCRARCPGTDVALYVHRNPGEDSDAMVSLAGEPYTVLPTAYRYRQEYDAACKCGQIAALPGARGEAVGFLPANQDDPWGFVRASETAGPLHGSTPLPISRPAPGEDPETLANRTGALVPEPVVPPEAAVADLGADGERSIRIVGPTYIYGQ